MNRKSAEFDDEVAKRSPSLNPPQRSIAQMISKGRNFCICLRFYKNMEYP